MTTSQRGAHRITLLTLGWEDLPKAWSVYGNEPTEKLVEPVPGVLVHCDDGVVLLDTGFNPALIKDPALYRRFHGRNGDIQAILPEGDGDPLLVGLEAAGVALSDIVGVGVSHLHNDHAGGLRHFSGGAPIYLQRREWDFGMSQHPVPESHGMFRIDYDDPKLNIRLLDAGEDEAQETEILSGITAVPTFGHTPGHQSFVVRMDERVGGGGFVFAFDAGDLRENFVHERPIGGVVGVPPEASVFGIRKLKAIAHAEDLVLVPGHDPVVWPKLSSHLATHGGKPHPELSTATLFEDASE